MQVGLKMLVEQPRVLDAISIIVYPLAFILFNLHYWFLADYDLNSSLDGRTG